MDLNKVMLIGNLTRDPEIRNTPSGQTVANFGLATNRFWKNEQGERQQMPEYHNIVAWGKLADICGQYLKKGNKVYIEGRMQTRDWQGQDGIKRYRTEVVARDLIMLTPLATRANAPMASSTIPTMQTAEEMPAATSPIATAETPETEMETTEETPENTEAQPKEAKKDDEEISIEDIPF